MLARKYNINTWSQKLDATNVSPNSIVHCSTLVCRVHRLFPYSNSDETMRSDTLVHWAQLLVTGAVDSSSTYQCIHALMVRRRHYYWLPSVCCPWTRPYYAPLKLCRICMLVMPCPINIIHWMLSYVYRYVGRHEYC